MLLLNVVLS